MGQKTNPIGLRIALNKDWRSKWYAEKKEFGRLLNEDRKIRDLLKRKLETASVPKIGIERAATRCRITIFTARPGVVIGRKGAEIDKIKEEISKMTGKEIYVDIQEVKNPETDAQLVAENIALQLERRISFRRAMKKAVQTAMDFKAVGIKVRCAGRLGGANWLVLRPITKEACRCIRCARILITDLPRPIPFTGSWESRCGSARVRTSPRRASRHRSGPRRMRRWRLPRLRKRRVELGFRFLGVCYGHDARKSEVPQNAAGCPPGNCLPRKRCRIWRVWVAGARALLDGYEAD